MPKFDIVFHGPRHGWGFRYYRTPDRKTHCLFFTFGSMVWGK